MSIFIAAKIIEMSCFTVLQNLYLFCPLKKVLCEFTIDHNIFFICFALFFYVQIHCGNIYKVDNCDNNKVYDKSI